MNDSVNVTAVADDGARKKDVKRKMRGIKRSAFAFPYLALSVIFVIVPLFIMLYYAFTDSATGEFTFDNFKRFTDGWSASLILGKSLLAALVTTVICFLLAYPLALALSSSALNKKFVLVMLFILPMWINSLLRTYAIKIVLSILNVPETGFAIWIRVIMGMVYDFFPFMLLPLYSVLSGMDRSLTEASQDLGASPVQTLFKVTLPLSVPGIVSGVLMVFMPTVSTFAISDILGNTDTYMFGNIINQWFNSSSGWNIGSAYSFILLILIAVTVLIANFITKGKTETGGIL